MTQNHALPGGVFAATLTPLDGDLGIDHAALAAHCRWLLANGCDGIVLLGTTGEANAFSLAERMAALDALVAAGLPAHRLLVGTGCCAAPDAVALTRHAVERGAGGVLMLPPFYYKDVTDEGLAAFFDRVIEQVGAAALQIYLYHIPQLSGVPFRRALIERLLARYPGTVAGIKDSGGDWDHMRALASALPGFRVFAGTERYLLDILEAGGVGCISATANVTCGLAAEVYAKRHTGEARALQDRLNAVRHALEAFPLTAALKHLMAARTHRPGWLRLRPPLTPLAAEEAAALDDALHRLGFLAEIA